MALTNASGRLIGRDLYLWQFVSTYGTADVLALYGGGSLDVRIERVDVTAVKDSGRRSRVAHYDWRMTCSTLVDSSVGAFYLFTHAVQTDIDDLAATLEVKDSIGTIFTFTGSVGHTGFGFRFDEAAQGEGAEFVGVGDLTYEGVVLTVGDWA